MNDNVYIMQQKIVSTGQIEQYQYIPNLTEEILRMLIANDQSLIVKNRLTTNEEKITKKNELIALWERKKNDDVEFYIPKSTWDCIKEKTSIFFKKNPALERMKELTCNERHGLLETAHNKLLETLAEETLADASAESFEVKKAAINEVTEETLLALQAGLETTEPITEAQKQREKQILTNFIDIIKEKLKKYGLTILDRVNKASKGIVVKHMKDVCFLTTYFHMYRNKLIINGGLGTHIRSQCSKKGVLYKYFDELIKRFKTEEATFMNDSFRYDDFLYKGNLHRISEEEITSRGLGALTHDCGKIGLLNGLYDNEDYIKYHESDAPYDRKKIITHPLFGFKNIKENTALGTTIANDALYHHGRIYHDDGYIDYQLTPMDFRRTLLKKNSSKAKNIRYLYAYDYKDVLNGEALYNDRTSILELIDIFVALAIDVRNYRNPMPPLEALKLIKSQHIDGHIAIGDIPSLKHKPAKMAALCHNREKSCIKGSKIFTLREDILQQKITVSFIDLKKDSPSASPQELSKTELQELSSEEKSFLKSSVAALQEKNFEPKYTYEEIDTLQGYTPKEKEELKNAYLKAIRNYIKINPVDFHILIKALAESGLVDPHDPFIRKNNIFEKVTTTEGV